MTERLVIKFAGAHLLPDENREKYDGPKTDSIEEAIRDIMVFAKSRLPKAESPVSFIRGDEGGPYSASSGTADEFEARLRKWLGAVYDLAMEVYGDESDFATTFLARIETTWCDNAGQFAVSVYFGPEDDVSLFYRLCVCEAKEEPM